MDQGLCSKILRIVNSAYYGFPKRISTITHAIMILGFNTVRNLVLGVSAFGMLPQKGIYIIENLDLEALARDKQTEFAFFCLPLKLRGATGAPSPCYAVPLK